MTIRTLLLAPDPDTATRLSEALAGQEGILSTTSQQGQAAELAAALTRGDVDIAIAAIPSVGAADLDRIESVLAARPNVSLILVTREGDSAFLLQAMRIGVREVVPLDAAHDALGAAVRRQVERHAASRGGGTQARVIAFMPAKGGSGATFLATNLAYALAALGQRVAVIDLNLQFGDAVLFISERRANSDIAQVATNVQRLDAPLLESSMLQAADNLWVLAAPESPERSIDVKPEAIERIIAVARAQFDFVILDVGRVMEAVAVRALDEAQTIYVVLQAALPSLHDAKRLLGVLRGLGYGADKCRVVLNRLDKAGDIGVPEIQKTLGTDVAFEIPNSYVNVVRSVNHGVPILKQSPKDPVSRALTDWAASLAPQSSKRSGWLRGMFGSRA
jgi:pilus assembly protein CpaE